VADGRATSNRVRRFIVMALIETTGGEGDYNGDPSGSYVRAVDFGRGGYITEVLESSCTEIAPWSDGEDD